MSARQSLPPAPATTSGLHLASATSATSATSWWHHPWMWLVVGGPLLVVAAAIVTAWIAMREADPVVTLDAPRLRAASQVDAEALRALVPAHQARNHATTPTADLPVQR